MVNQTKTNSTADVNIREVSDVTMVTVVHLINCGYGWPRCIFIQTRCRRTLHDWPAVQYRPPERPRARLSAHALGRRRDDHSRAHGRPVRPPSALQTTTDDSLHNTGQFGAPVIMTVWFNRSTTTGVWLVIGKRRYCLLRRQLRAGADVMRLRHRWVRCEQVRWTCCRRRLIPPPTGRRAPAATTHPTSARVRRFTTASNTWHCARKPPPTGKWHTCL